MSCVCPDVISISRTGKNWTVQPSVALGGSCGLAGMDSATIDNGQCRDKNECELELHSATVSDAGKITCMYADLTPIIPKSVVTYMTKLQRNVSVHSPNAWQKTCQAFNDCSWS